ncbi:MAG: TonB-dependent receptor [Mucilaginibacter sp.]|nr:TonB-dependent receptor [Mucilaginibacter sp.]
MYKALCSIIAFILCANVAFSQADSTKLNISDTKLKTLLSLPITEKAYLHFDKPYYAPGDTIYFKAYVTMGERHEPSKISGVLHADLIDPANKIQQSVKLQLVNGISWGDFTLPDSLYNGNYRIRVYTQWMRNSTDPIFFEQIISVGDIKNTPNQNTSNQYIKNNKADIAFFPEGGNLVAGISSNIAFKAIDINGLGINVSGIIVDSDSKQIISISSIHLGMGSFYLTPKSGKSYKAILAYADGSKATVDLPMIEQRGIVLSVNNDSIAKASVSIEANKAYYDENHDKDYTVIIYAAGKATSVKYKLDNPIISFDIMKRRLGTGIAMVTLFSPANEPLCERLIFVQNYDQLSLAVKTDKPVYGPKEKVSINLQAINRVGELTTGQFSVSVTDESKVPIDEKNESTILNNLLLISDLKGYIEQPNYYFSNISEKISHDLDLVMLTHGYRRFQWKHILNESQPSIKYQPEKGIEINGIANSLGGKPLVNGTVSLISPADQIMSQTTDDKGIFRFSNLIFTDTAKFILQAVNRKGKNTTKLTYNRTENKPYITSQIATQQDTATSRIMSSHIENATKQNQQLSKIGKLKGKMLKEVMIKSNKRYTPKMTTRYGVADQTIPAEQIGSDGQLIYKLMPLLRGVRFVSASSIEVNFYKPELTGPSFRAVPFKVVVNDVEMDSQFNINSIDPSQVENIDIVRNPLSPAIIFTIQQGVNPRYITSIGILPITVNGFYKAREFYSPKYDHQDNNKDLDYRSTIFWKPNLITDKDGNASFDYYNADGTGNYRIVIEGFDGKGNLGRQVYRYKVQ